MASPRRRPNQITSSAVQKSKKSRRAIHSARGSHGSSPGRGSYWKPTSNTGDFGHGFPWVPAVWSDSRTRRERRKGGLLDRDEERSLCACLLAKIGGHLGHPRSIPLAGARSIEPGRMLGDMRVGRGITVMSSSCGAFWSLWEEFGVDDFVRSPRVR